MLRGPGSDPAANATIRTALEAGQPVRTEMLNYAKDGHTYWVDLNIVPLRGENGDIAHFAAIQRDISEWKQLEEELTRQATTDALTGLHNRRAFFDSAAAEIARCRRYGAPLSVVIIDIDRFKLINDKYGHAAGDATLVRFADICRHHVREVDLVARIGGEEFALLLPATSPDNAARLAERIRKATNEITVLADGQSLDFTVSMGVADEALYNAKKLGRDRICLAEDEDAGDMADTLVALGC